MSGRDVTAREIQLWQSDINCIWEKTRDSVAEKEEQKVPRLIKVFLEKEKTFVGTATELCCKLKEMFNEDFSANSLGKILNKCQFVLMKQGMAMGTDIWTAEIVLERKKRNTDLHLICALPHPNFESRRSMTEKMRCSSFIYFYDCIGFKNISCPFRFFANLQECSGFYQLKNHHGFSRPDNTFTFFHSLYTIILLKASGNHLIFRASV